MKRKYDSHMLLRPKTAGCVNITIGEIEDNYKLGNIITLIKLWRSLTGMGLKDSKDNIERLIGRTQNTSFPFTWDQSIEAREKVVNGFIEQSYLPELTKEEFMNMISEAVDNMGKFHCNDMMEAVEFLFKGIRQKGGLIKISEEHDRFLEGI